MGRGVYVSVSVVVPVGDESWTTSPNVRAALGVEEEPVKLKVWSSTFVTSGEEEMVFAKCLCVAVCVSSWEDVSGGGEFVLCGVFV